MHDVMTFLLGATVIFAALFGWWTHRRFTRFKGLFSEVLQRHKELDNGLRRHAQALELADARLDTHDHQIAFLTENRVIPPAPEPQRRVSAEKAPKTAWDHLNDRVDEL
jgi:hypothetical protein